MASSAADRRSVTPAMPMSQAICRSSSLSGSPSRPSVSRDHAAGVVGGQQQVRLAVRTQHAHGGWFVR